MTRTRAIEAQGLVWFPPVCLLYMVLTLMEQCVRLESVFEVSITGMSCDSGDVKTRCPDSIVGSVHRVGVDSDDLGRWG